MSAEIVPAFYANHSKTPVVILYHSNCADGMTAAMWTYLYAMYCLPEAGLKEFIGDSLAGASQVCAAAQYNTETDFNNIRLDCGDLVDLQDKIVYIVDFSYNKEQTEKLCEIASHVVIIDHHATARWLTAPTNPNSIQEGEAGEDGNPLNPIQPDFENTESENFVWITRPKNLKIMFFEHDCGASICQYFMGPLLYKTSCPKEPLGVLRSITPYVKDRDLWQWKLISSREFSAGYREILDNGILALEHAICREGNLLKECMSSGSYIRTYEQKMAKRTAAKAEVFDLDEWMELHIVNAPNLQSEVGEMIYTRVTDSIACMWFVVEDGFVCSLRSQYPIVNKIAKALGGGGHPKAAGFKLLFADCNSSKPSEAIHSAIAKVWEPKWATEEKPVLEGI